MLTRLVLISLLVAWAAPGLAGTASELASIDQRLKACLEKNGDNTGMKECTYSAEAAADKVLNRVYKTFVDRLKRTSDDGDRAADQETLKRLVASERAWIAYRDTECSLQGTQMLNGTGEGLVVGQCLYDLARERATSLDRLAEPK